MFNMTPLEWLSAIKPQHKQTNIVKVDFGYKIVFTQQLETLWDIFMKL